MTIFRGDFYVNDDVTLKGRFESDGEPQTPDAGSGLIEIWQKGKVDNNGDAEAYLESTAATISGTTIYYKTSDLEVGEYVAYITAKFNSGADERTGEIKFAVKSKEGIW